MQITRQIDRNICIIGLGYVGLTLAVAMARAGFRVHGVEINKSIVKTLRTKRAHFTEAGFDHALREQIEAGRLTFSTSMPPQHDYSTYIITVGTPLDGENRSDTSSLAKVIQTLSSQIKDDDLVILRSTVTIGTTRKTFEDLKEKTGIETRIAFCPERTIEGRALSELETLPQIIGGIDHDSFIRSKGIFNRITPNIVAVSNPETAEMIKLVNNTQRDLNFAFANEVALMAQACNLSASEVISSANFEYPRSNLASPGPVGGPCLEKDPYILAESLEKYKYVPALSLLARKVNSDLPFDIVSKINALFQERQKRRITRATILGLAFKGRPATNDMRGTMAIPLIEALRASNPAIEICGWDPVAEPSAVSNLNIDASTDLLQASRHSDLIVIQNNHPFFGQMDLNEIAEVMQSGGIIYDFWSQHHGANRKLSNNAIYCALGEGKSGG